MRLPGRVCRLIALAGGSEPALAQRAQPRVGRAAIAHLALPMHRDFGIDRDLDLPAQTIKRQPLGEILRRIGLAIEQQLALGTRPDDEIEQHLALRRQQPRIGGERASNVIGDEPLKEVGNVFLRGLGPQADYGAVEQAGSSHG